MPERDDDSRAGDDPRDRDDPRAAGGVSADDPAARARDARAWRRLAGLLAVFVGLTLLGVWWAAPSGDEMAAAWRHLASLPWHTHALLVALAVSMIAVEMLRLHIFGRALGLRIGARATLDATIANYTFSYLTPGAALGEPAATYMLGRHGVPWDAAVLITFGKFATSFALILTLTCALLALGLGPPVPSWVVVPLAIAIGLGAAMMVSLVAGALWPRAAERAIGWVARRLDFRLIVRTCEVAARAVHRLATFRRAGMPGLLAMLASHIAYYASFIGILIVLAVAFGARAGEATPIAIIYQGFLYLIPTPGASGVSEASATPFFGALLPGGAAFAVVILYRVFTAYVHVAIGLVYLPVVGAVTDVLTGRGAAPAALAREDGERSGA